MQNVLSGMWKAFAQLMNSKVDKNLQPELPSVDMIYKLNLEGYFTYVNASSALFFSSTAQKLVGAYYTDLIREDWREKAKAFYIKQLEQEKPSTYFEFPVINIKGKEKWLGQTAELIFENGKPKEILAVARDVTPRKEAELKLEKTDSWLSAVVNNLNTALLVEDEEGQVVYINQQFIDFFEVALKPEEIVGQDTENARAYKHLFKDPQQFLIRFEDLRKHKKAVFSEKVYLKSGRIMERDFIPMYADSLYTGNLWQYRDVTERVVLEEQIKESEEKYRSIIENINLGLLEVDLEQKIRYANNSFCTIMGYSRKELIGAYADEVLLPLADKEEQLKVVEDANDLRKQGTTSAYELKLKKKNGEPVWMIISGAPITNTEGKVVGSIGIHNDITDRKINELHRKELLEELKSTNEELRAKQEYLQEALDKQQEAEIALRDSEEVLRVTLNSAMDAVITINEQGKVMGWNSMAEQMFGYGIHEVQNKLLSDLIIPEKYRRAHDAGMAHFLKTGDGPVLNKRIEIVGVNKKGDHMPVELSIVPLKLAHGYIFSAFIRDIAQKKQAEEDMAAALEEQKKLSRMRSRFVSMTSHEFRTPLTTIKTNVDIIRFMMEKDDQAEKNSGLLKPIDRIENEIQRLDTLMGEILLIGKLNDGKIDFAPQPTDLMAYCHDLIHKQFSPWIDGRSVDFSFEGVPRLISVDGKILHHILVNLLSNALKYSAGKNNPQLHIKYALDRTVISVIDNGIGIPYNEQEQVFSSFYRAQNVANVQGTGMGLAVVKQFADLHRMQINLISAEDSGTEIMLTLK